MHAINDIFQAPSVALNSDLHQVQAFAAADIQENSLLETDILSSLANVCHTIT